MRILSVSIVFLSLSLLVSGCGDSGSGASGVPTTGTSGSGAGSVAFFVKDMPLDGITALWVTIERAELIGDDGQVLLFEGERRVNLLQFRDHEFLLTYKDDVPAGVYDKIRLRVSDPDVEPNPDDLPVTISGNGKIDLKPHGSFEVREDSLLSIHIDVDVPRSVHIHQTGNGRIKVRPVIFVRIEAEHPVPLELADLTGEITSITEDKRMLSILLDDGAGEIEASVTDESTLFTTDVELGELVDFEIGDRVLVRGRLSSRDEVEVEVMFQGDPLRLRGQVEDDAMPFAFLADPGQALAGSVDTSIVDGARSYVEHGEEIELADYAVGTRALLTGRFFAGPSEYLVGLVDVECQRISGTIDSLALDSDPQTIVVEVEGGEAIEVALDLDDGTVLRLVGDGPVPEEFLSPGLSVECKLMGSVSGVRKAVEILVTPIRYEGTVTDVDDDFMIVTVEIGTDEVELALRGDATILLISDDSVSTIELSDVLIGDEIEAFGLETIEGDPTIWVLIVQR